MPEAERGLGGGRGGQRDSRAGGVGPRQVGSQCQWQGMEEVGGDGNLGGERGSTQTERLQEGRVGGHGFPLA